MPSFGSPGTTTSTTTTRSAHKTMAYSGVSERSLEYRVGGPLRLTRPTGRGPARVQGGRGGSGQCARACFPPSQASLPGVVPQPRWTRRGVLGTNP